MSEQRFPSDDPIQLLEVERLLMSAHSIQETDAERRQVAELLRGIRAEIQQLFDDEFDAIVYWLTADRPGPPDDGATP